MSTTHTRTPGLLGRSRREQPSPIRMAAMSSMRIACSSSLENASLEAAPWEDAPLEDARISLIAVPLQSLIRGRTGGLGGPTTIWLLPDAYFPVPRKRHKRILWRSDTNQI